MDLILSDVQIGEEEVTYWHKPVNAALNVFLTHRLLGIDSTTGKDMIKADIVMGGDHGQRKFLMLVKVIGRRADGSVSSVSLLKITQIDCQKNTYEMLKKMIAAPINEGLEELLGDGVFLNFYQHKIFS